MQRILVACAISVTMMTATVFAEETEPRQVLFTNVNIFNGVDAEIIKGGCVSSEGWHVQQELVLPG